MEYSSESVPKSTPVLESDSSLSHQQDESPSVHQKPADFEQDKPLPVDVSSQNSHNLKTENPDLIPDPIPSNPKGKRKYVFTEARRMQLENANKLRLEKIRKRKMENSKNNIEENKNEIVIKKEPEELPKEDAPSEQNENDDNYEELKTPTKYIESNSDNEIPPPKKRKNWGLEYFIPHFTF